MVSSQTLIIILRGVNLSPLLIVIDVPISLSGHAAFVTDTDHLEQLKSLNIDASLAKTSSRFQPPSVSDTTPEIPNLLQ